MLRTALFAFWLLIVMSTLHADITWEKTVLEFHPRATDTEATGEFRFKNTGTAPIRIDSVESDCGCTTAILDKNTLAPGEAGTVKATFTFGARRGRYEKHLRVQIADEEKPVTLALVVFIPEQVRFVPEFVYWRAGERPEPKAIRIKILPEADALRVTDVSSSTPHLNVAFETVVEGKEYVLKIQPKDTATEAVAVLTITAVPENGGAPRTFEAYAQVKPSVQ